MNVPVKDKQGNDVKGLVASDFSVREDGDPQKIEFFDAGTGPVSVAVLVDSSGSMARSGRFGSAQDIAARFMRMARPGDQIWAMDFTEWTGPFQQLIAEQLSSSGPVPLPLAGGSGSAVNDAIASAICHLRDSKNPRQAIIVITDGVDEHSRVSLDRLIQFVRSQRAQLFLIGTPSRSEFNFEKHPEPKVTLVTGRDIDNPVVEFDRLAKEAGAETFIPKSESGLEDALKAVSNLLDSEYTLAYYPTKTSHKVRKIEVKVNRSGAHVLAGRFVVANPDSGEMVHFVEGTCTVSPEQNPYPYDSHVTNDPAGTVYRDDFSDRESGWPQHPDSHYIFGGYELTSIKPPSADDAPPRETMNVGVRVGQSTNLVATYEENVVAAYGPSWHDFRVSAAIRPVFGSNSGGQEQKFTKPIRAAAGLVFRMNQNGYYAVLIGPSPQHPKKLAVEVVARTFSGGSFAEIVIIPWTTVDWASPAGLQLVVENVGNQIGIFVDGQPVGSARDDTFTEGYAGFTVSAPVHAVFSNLVVEQTSLFRPATPVAFAQAELSPSESEHEAPIAHPLIVLAQTAADDEPWLNKRYDTWNGKDIESVMTRSPWVQKTGIRRTWTVVSQNDKNAALDPLISGGVREYPDARGATQTNPEATVRSGQESTEQLIVDVKVYWDSSRAMRAAQARQLVLKDQMKDSDVEQFAYTPQEEYQIVLTMGDMTPFLQTDEKRLQATSFLEMKRSKLKLSPTHVIYQKDGSGIPRQAVFFFPKKIGSGPTIGSDETDVEFKCKIADSTLRVQFKPKKMTDQFGLDL